MVAFGTYFSLLCSSVHSLHFPAIFPRISFNNISFALTSFTGSTDCCFDKKLMFKISLAYVRGLFMQPGPRNIRCLWLEAVGGFFGLITILLQRPDRL